jgi:hypothetical protein
MPIQTADTTIANVNYKLTTLPATEGLEVLTRLLGMIGEPIGLLAAAASNGKTKLQDMDGEMLAKSLTAICANIAHPGTVKLMKTLLEGLTYETTAGNGKPFFKKVNFDVDFSRQYHVIMQLVRFALEANYKDFFVAMFGSLSELAPKGKDDQSPPDSTGE